MEDYIEEAQKQMMMLQNLQNYALYFLVIALGLFIILLLWNLLHKNTEKVEEYVMGFVVMLFAMVLVFSIAKYGVNFKYIPFTIIHTFKG